jgi:hypothetical protein
LVHRFPRSGIKTKLHASGLKFPLHRVDKGVGRGISPWFR